MMEIESGSGSIQSGDESFSRDQLSLACGDVSAPDRVGEVVAEVEDHWRLDVPCYSIVFDYIDLRACPGRLEGSTTKTTLASLLVFSTDRVLLTCSCIY